LREGDARRLDRLQVDRREQPRLCLVAAVLRRVGEHGGKGPDALALDRGDRGRRIARLGEVAHGGKRARDVIEAVGAHHDDRGAFRLRQPGTADQRAGGAVGRQGGGGSEMDRRHGYSLRGIVQQIQRSS
jgi:hypothetical protein